MKTQDEMDKEAGMFWQEVQKICRQRDNFQKAIKSWLAYDGNAGDAVYTEYFNKILKENQ